MGRPTRLSAVPKTIAPTPSVSPARTIPGGIAAVRAIDHLPGTSHASFDPTAEAPFAEGGAMSSWTRPWLGTRAFRLRLRAVGVERLGRQPGDK
jgi:hypothetical protein